jgi:hypothetical protein
MENQVYDRTDVFTFLGDIAKRLSKESDCLRALSDTWFEKNTDENDCLAMSSADIARLGRQLLGIREQLCQACATKEVAEGLIFTLAPKDDPSPKE